MTTSPRISSDSETYHNDMVLEVRVLCCPKTLCWTDRNCDVISELKKGEMKPSIVKSPKDVTRMTSQLTLNIPTVVVLCDHNKMILKAACEGISQEHVNNLVLVASRPDTSGLFKGFEIMVLTHNWVSQQLVNIMLSKTRNRQSHLYTNNVFHETKQGSSSEYNDEVSSQQALFRPLSESSLIENVHETQTQSRAFDPTGAVVSTGLYRKKADRTRSDVFGDIFVNTKSGCPEEGLRGVFVRQRTYTGEDYNGETFDVFLEKFLSSDETDAQYQTRVITNSWIPQCREKNEFVPLIHLMKGGDSSLQKLLAEVAFEIQLNTKDRSCNIEHLLTGLNSFVDICQSTYSDTDLVEKFTPLFLNTVSLLLACMVVKESDGETIPYVLSQCNQALTTASGIRGKGHIAANCMYPITEILTCMVHQLRSNSKLQKSKYKDAVSNKKLQKYISKMSFLDMYSLFLDILQRLKQKYISEDVDALKYMVHCLLDKHQKQTKTEPLTHAILMCVTQGIVTLIKGAFARNEQGISEELDIMKLLDVMTLYFDNRKCGQVMRTHLLSEVECLLFLKDKDLVHNVWYWHNMSGMQSQQLQNKTLDHIEQLLQPLNFRILRADYVPSIAFSPAWCTLHGTATGPRDVTLHCLLPSMQCLLGGSMADYKVKADKVDTKYEINTLEILRIIQAEGNHQSILSLHAYQCRPLPLFFVVDRYKGADLFSYLHQRRKDNNWINLSALASIAYDILSAVDFLHSKKVLHRNLTASSFALDHNKRIVLTDFSIAKHVDASEVSVQDLEGTGVPTRWTAPESLLEGRFDVRTDTWMVGQLLYEIYTHGCQPFVELYTISTEKVMEWVVFQKLMPKQWPCIPRKVHDVILKCVHTEADERVDLLSARHVFLSYRHSPANAQPRLPVSRACDEDRLYPDLPSNHSQTMAIERGIPRFFLSLRKGKLGPRCSYMYMNERRLQRMVSVILEATHQDLLSPDQPRYSTKDCFIEVTEPVTQAFVENVYPLLTGLVMKWLHIRHWPVVVQDHASTGALDFNCSLVYGCDQGENILDLALANRLGSPSVPENMAKYYGIVQSLAGLISSMHAKDFILRDLCAANTFYCEASDKVFIPRLGRMLHLGSNCTLDDSILADKPPNRNRWLPIEVLQSAQYSKQSDMYAFAMTMFEFFTALDALTKDPNANTLKTVPFATVKTSLLLEHLYKGETPGKPTLCPGWLYEIMQKCWDRDRTQRPDIDDVFRLLHDRLNGKAVEADSGYDSLHQPPKHRRATPSGLYRIGRIPLRSGSLGQLAFTTSRNLSVTTLERIESMKMLNDADSVFSCDRSSCGTSCFCSDCESNTGDVPFIPLREKSNVGRRCLSKDRITMYDKIPERSSAFDKRSRCDITSMYDTVPGLTPTEIRNMKRDTAMKKALLNRQAGSSQTLPYYPSRNLDKKMLTPEEQRKKMIQIPVPQKSNTLPPKTRSLDVYVTSV
ncbi:uncharacterized protein LOC110453416 [Mizuhopecten yessoensis]|uniref:Tyrosine-protein kinase SRK3 n=1 Tax=Mizuhopecten yessoensis TaxID=6573 RepID=A0A210QHF3_MIZYE|nr:uncharacterized protein LOC110453416 [Mizuhopecten yessoensis]XP_021358035.1 uncharacterized protein LOC110453416 [Mizuhopecten yessoensis]OWF48174.1 Tyrosine-protein kinase SRK3 [Mizuhopecten yessoensis]